MSYSILLFDIDDTLLDFHATENRALELLFEKHGIKLTDTVKDNYVKFNQSLWKKLELGEISRQELMTNRFTTFFKKEFNLNIDGLSLNREYLEFLSTGTDTIPGAKDLLSTLKKSGHKLYVVTNGIDFVQERRLRNTGFSIRFLMISLFLKKLAIKNQMLDFLRTYLMSYLNSILMIRLLLVTHLHLTFKVGTMLT